MANNNVINIEKLKLQKPRVSLSCPEPLRMWLAAFAAFIAIMQSAFTDSFRSLGLALLAAAAALLTEFCFLYRNGKTAMLKDGSAVASALVFTLLLPNQISPVYAVLGIVFSIAVIKHCFGGLGSNWLNPAAGGWLFVRLAWPDSFNLALKVPADFAAQAGFFETNLRPVLNNTVFAFFKTELPSGYLDFLTSTRPGIIADRGVLALLLGSILIIAFRAGRTWVPVIWLAVFLFLTRLAGNAAVWSGDIFLTLCSGGTLAVAFLLAMDPVTNGKSIICAAVAAAAGGFLAWLFRFPGGELYGAVISVLAINALLPAFRTIENYLLYERRTS